LGGVVRAACLTARTHPAPITIDKDSNIRPILKESVAVFTDPRM
jgi:hypothetical protein